MGLGKKIQHKAAKAAHMDTRRKAVHKPKPGRFTADPRAVANAKAMERKR